MKVVKDGQSKKHDLVVLYSGGADSTLLLKLAESMGRRVFAVMIDYGQKHIEELEFAKKYLEDHEIDGKTIKISGYDVNSGLTGSGKQNLYEGVHSHNVPARNSIFLSIAYGVAESMGITEVWYGPDYSDREGLFPDCYQDYVYNLNKVFAISGVKPVRVYAPLLGFTKDMVLKVLESYGITKDKLYSGYGEFS